MNRYDPKSDDDDDDDYAADCTQVSFIFEIQKNIFFNSFFISVFKQIKFNNFLIRRFFNKKIFQKISAKK